MQKLKVLGNGSFSRVELKLNGNVRIITDDPIKRAMADGVFPDHPLFPKVTKIGTEKNSGKSIYEMERLDVIDGWDDVRACLNKRNVRLFKALHKMRTCDHQSTWDALYYELPNEFERERNVIMDAISNLQEYYDIDDVVNLDFLFGNVAHQNGRIVLMDIFFPVSELREKLDTKYESQSKVSS